MVHLPNLAISTHTGYHCTSDLVFCHFYENLDEERNEAVSLWQQHLPRTQIDVNTFEFSI